MLTTGINETTCGETSRRTWATLTSFAIQATSVGIALLLPMIYTQGLPQLKILSQALIANPAPPPDAPAPACSDTRPPPRYRPPRMPKPRDGQPTAQTPAQQ